MHAVTGTGNVVTTSVRGRVSRVAAVSLAAGALMAALAACQAPFGLDTPSTRALEFGAVARLTPGASFEISGSYQENGAPWTVDLQFGGPGKEHALVTQGNVKLEAILIGGQAYFRGQEFLSQHLGTASAARTLVQAAGNAWWKAPASNVPTLADFTNGERLRATFLGPAVSRRADHVSVNGVDTADLSGPRADAYIAESAPYDLVRLRLKPGASIDGVTYADLSYSFDKSFTITAPTDVIDFSNLSTLPPLYTVVSVDTSRCASVCVVSAVIKNLGGTHGASKPSTVVFNMTANASGAVLGSCSVQVVPDVGYNATTTVTCTISLTGQQTNAAVVTATVDNPGRG
jgi:hypothetical protein